MIPFFILSILIDVIDDNICRDDHHILLFKILNNRII